MTYPAWQREGEEEKLVGGPLYRYIHNRQTNRRPYKENSVTRGCSRRSLSVFLRPSVYLSIDSQTTVIPHHGALLPLYWQLCVHNVGFYTQGRCYWTPDLPSVCSFLQFPCMESCGGVRCACLVAWMPMVSDHAIDDVLKLGGAILC